MKSRSQLDPLRNPARFSRSLAYRKSYTPHEPIGGGNFRAGNGVLTRRPPRDLDACRRRSLSTSPGATVARGSLWYVPRLGFAASSPQGSPAEPPRSGSQLVTLRRSLEARVGIEPASKLFSVFMYLRICKLITLPRRKPQAISCSPPNPSHSPPHAVRIKQPCPCLSRAHAAAIFAAAVSLVSRNNCGESR